MEEIACNALFIISSKILLNNETLISISNLHNKGMFLTSLEVVSNLLLFLQLFDQVDYRLVLREEIYPQFHNMKNIGEE